MRLVLNTQEIDVDVRDRVICESETGGGGELTGGGWLPKLMYLLLPFTLTSPVNEEARGMVCSHDHCKNLGEKLRKNAQSVQRDGIVDGFTI